MAWFKLASHLGLPLQEVMAKTTSKEFVEWMVYLETERNEPTKEDYYHALIAAEVRRTCAKDPRKVNVEDFLLTFKTGKETKEELETEEERESRVARSKAFWRSILGGKNATVRK